jgi:cardiolipin synthase
MTALLTAALSCIKVNILMTGIPDKKIPYWAANTYFEPLLNAGVNIFHYKKGFLHSKTVVIDNSIVSIGSCNMDIRGFHINFELNALIYDRETAEEMVKGFYNDLKFSETITREHIKKSGIFKKFRNSIFRILSPIM